MDDERTMVAYASTRHMDRDYEIVMPSGMLLGSFQKAPHLLWNHKWSEPPIGHDAFIGSDGLGLAARSHFATTSFAEDIWTLVKGKHLRTSSIGFITLEYIDQYNPKFGPTVDLMRQRWPEFEKEQADNLRGIHLRAVLMEHSIVSVPANPEALVIAISEKSLDVAAKTLDEFNLDFTVTRKCDDFPVDSVEDPADSVAADPPDSVDLNELNEIVESEHRIDPNEVTDPEENPDAEPEKSCRLVARLVCRPELAPVKSAAEIQRDIAQIVQETLELARGRI